MQNKAIKAVLIWSRLLRWPKEFLLMDKIDTGQDMKKAHKVDRLDSKSSPSSQKEKENNGRHINDTRSKDNLILVKFHFVYIFSVCLVSPNVTSFLSFAITAYTTINTYSSDVGFVYLLYGRYFDYYVC